MPMHKRPIRASSSIKQSTPIKHEMLKSVAIVSLFIFCFGVLEAHHLSRDSAELSENLSYQIESRQNRLADKKNDIDLPGINYPGLIIRAIRPITDRLSKTAQKTDEK